MENKSTGAGKEVKHLRMFKSLRRIKDVRECASNLLNRITCGSEKIERLQEKNPDPTLPTLSETLNSFGDVIEKECIEIIQLLDNIADELF